MNKLVVSWLLVVGWLVIGCSNTPELTRKEKAVNKIISIDSLDCDDKLFLIKAVMNLK